MVGKNILYIITEDSLSKEAIRILKTSNIEFCPIVIDLDGVGKCMWRDTRNLEVPSLLTATKMYSGVEEISKFAGMNCFQRE